MVGFPLLLIPLTVYNIIAFLMPGVSFTDSLVKLPLVSGAEWPISLSDVLLTLAVLLLLLEIIKGARPGAKYLTDHLLSLVVFGASAAEFVMWPKFGTSTYFLLSLLALVDFLSGLTLRTRRVVQPVPRPVAVTPTEPRLEPQSESEPVAPPAPEPVVTPARAPPSAASIAESVLMDHPEPRMAQPVVSASEPEAAVPVSEPKPAIASPELQPEAGAPAAPESPQH
ncbi:hypothetical protein [Bradyrhizobium sp.]|uniref:hypothetical protein n=1 Tax=Bradyrhizobium sp. TaxID=376 RepID=UPI003C3A0151